MRYSPSGSSACSPARGGVAMQQRVNDPAKEGYSGQLRRCRR